MDPTKEKSELEDLFASFKDYATADTGAISGAIGASDTMVYGLGGLADTITLTPSWNTGVGGNISVNNLPNVTISGAGYNFSNTAISAGAYTVGSAVGANWNNQLSGVLDLNGNNADIKINGKSLVETLLALEQRLNILTPNPKLEDEWDELRELGERYRALEKQCMEKAEMWAKLKSMPAPTIT
jgi:hypothetical protein